MAVVTKHKIKHGTVDGYVNHKCSCPRCRKAWRLYIRDRRAALRKAAAS